MFKSLALLGFSHFSRIISNVLLFVILARLWGPEKFGHFMYWFAVCNVIALASDLGAQNYLLETIGADRDGASHHFNTMYRARYYLTVLIAVCAVIFVLLQLNLADGLLFLILLCTAFATTFTELHMIPLRALNQLGSEARDTALISLATVIVIASIAYFLPNNILFVASGFLVARIVTLLVAQKRRQIWIASQHSTTLKLPWKKIIPFGIDSAITNFSSGLDSILMQKLSGTAGVGLYQAGVRLAQGALTFAPVIAGVFLPRLAGLKQPHINKSFTENPASQLRLCMSGIGFLGGATFVLLGPWIVLTLYGHAYLGLAAMMPWFGIAVQLRYVAAGVGVALSAAGAQWMRLSSNIAFVITLAGASVLLAPSLGLVAVAAALALANFVMFAINLYGVYATKNPHKPKLINVLFDLVAISLLVSYTLATFHTF